MKHPQPPPRPAASDASLLLLMWLMNSNCAEWVASILPRREQLQKAGATTARACGVISGMSEMPTMQLAGSASAPQLLALQGMIDVAFLQQPALHNGGRSPAQEILAQGETELSAERLCQVRFSVLASVHAPARPAVSNGSRQCRSATRTGDEEERHRVLPTLQGFRAYDMCGGGAPHGTNLLRWRALSRHPCGDTAVSGHS